MFYENGTYVHTFTFVPNQPVSLTLWMHKEYLDYNPGFYDNEPFCFGPSECCEPAETFPIDNGDPNSRGEYLRQNNLLAFVPQICC